jgi:23S rRNA (uracil1939-C5)-methyltransferase
MMQAAALVTLDVEKPVAGGRMLARHEGQVVLVWGAIPGERVRARIERVGKGVAYATTEDVLSASADRRSTPGDWRCGGNVFAHVAYSRQLQLKADIIRDAFSRIGRLPLGTAPVVTGSPETGYRMRARLHAHGARLGFYREGSHELCDATSTGQLSEGACDWLVRAQAVLASQRLSGLAAVELSENVPGGVRACHLELQSHADVRRFAALADGLVGLSVSQIGRAGVERLAGDPMLAETLHARAGEAPTAFRLRRHVRSFFQGNRFLLGTLLDRVVHHAGTGRIVDLYAGVGLFGLGLAAAGAEAVTLVEGDPISGADLDANAAVFKGRARVVRQSVETFVGSRAAADAGDTFVLDPPRTGMSKEALVRMTGLRPARIVYVSCDVATLARDARLLVDAGYEIARLDAFDLFPRTGHVETLVVFRDGRALA